VRVNVAELLGERPAVRRVRFAERFASPADDATLLEAVAGELSLTGAGGRVSLTGRLHTTVGLVCGACLRSFPEPLDFTVDEEFARVGESAETPRGEVALDRDDFVVPIGTDDTIDLSDVVRQHLVLALPIAPRCAADCRGLCANCGADLNAGPCGCPQEELDPRLQALGRWGAGREQPPS
jgi:uncharacterized protein